MTLQQSLSRSLASLGLTLLVLAATGSEGFAAEPGNVLIVIGPSGHPAGTHEVAAGAPPDGSLPGERGERRRNLGHRFGRLARG